VFPELPSYTDSCVFGVCVRCASTGGFSCRRKFIHKAAMTLLLQINPHSNIPQCCITRPRSYTTKLSRPLTKSIGGRRKTLANLSAAQRGRGSIAQSFCVMRSGRLKLRGKRSADIRHHSAHRQT
jgi:hypothetical protein